MDVMPVSGTLPLSTPTTGDAAVQHFPLARSVLEARKKLAMTPELDDVIHYVSILFVLYSEARHLWAHIVEVPALQIDWTFSERIISRPNLEKEVMLALSFLCSTLGARAETLARNFKSHEAQETFLQCAFAFEILAAFATRAHSHKKDERDTAVARARLARMFAWQSQFAMLMRDGDGDAIAVGLGLAAEYWRLSQTELASVPQCASLATGYAHYCLMLCAETKADQIAGETDDSVGEKHQARLFRLESLYALAALEAERAATVFEKRPNVRDTCLAKSRAMKKKQEAKREERFKWLLILAQEEKLSPPPAATDPKNDDIFAQGSLELFDVKPATPPLSGAPIPLAKNPLLQSIQASSRAWLLLQGGSIGLRGPVAPVTPPPRATSVDVSKQLAADVAAPDLILNGRDELVLVLGRMVERQQWVKNGGTSVLMLPGEREQLDLTIAQLATLLKSQKTSN